MKYQWNTKFLMKTCVIIIIISFLSASNSYLFVPLFWTTLVLNISYLKWVSCFKMSIYYICMMLSCTRLRHRAGNTFKAVYLRSNWIMQRLSLLSSVQYRFRFFWHPYVCCMSILSVFFSSGFIFLWWTDNDQIKCEYEWGNEDSFIFTVHISKPIHPPLALIRS